MRRKSLQAIKKNHVGRKVAQRCAYRRRIDIGKQDRIDIGRMLCLAM
jgi:hypothetical protein